jgi:hypothetical protein
LKQIDYLKLVATGRKSIHYARPSDADDDLTGLIGVCFIISLILTFGVAVVASFCGELIDGEMLAWPLAATVLPGIGYMVSGFFIGGAPRLVRYGILTIGAITAIMLSYFAVTGSLDGWYLFIAPFLFALTASIGAVKQL